MGPACTGGSYAAPGIINPTYQTFLTASNTVTANTNLALLQTTYPINLCALTWFMTTTLLQCLL